MNNPSNKKDKIDPRLRERLLKETKNPLLGPRRILWTTLCGAAGFGLLIMLSRVLGGEEVPGNDLAIQLGAFSLFGGLVWLDNRKKD